MPRPRKHRRVCGRPRFDSFGPCGRGEKPAQTMTVDEFEAIRLIDREGLTQAECAEQMGVARTTVQAIYAAARGKLAEFLVSGRPLHIEGGDVRPCEHGRGRGCRQGRPEAAGEGENHADCDSV